MPVHAHTHQTQSLTHPSIPFNTAAARSQTSTLLHPANTNTTELRQPLHMQYSITHGHTLPQKPNTGVCLTAVQEHTSPLPW
jgi:hypothetical protein